MSIWSDRAIDYVSIGNYIVDFTSFISTPRIALPCGIV